MTKESIYELQKIDCNCNDCKYMQRDFEEFKKWEMIECSRQQLIFDKKKEEAFIIANACPDPAGKVTLLAIANKMRFIFDRQHLLTYGVCNKFDKTISFIPAICQLETQDCFVHRKD